MTIAERIRQLESLNKKIQEKEQLLRLQEHDLREFETRGVYVNVGRIILYPKVGNELHQLVLATAKAEVEKQREYILELKTKAENI